MPVMTMKELLSIQTKMVMEFQVIYIMDYIRFIR